MAYDVKIIEVPRRDVAVVRTRTTFDGIPAAMGSAFGRVAAVLGPRGLLGDGPAVGRYTEMDPATGKVTVAAGFVVPAAIEAAGDVVPDELPAGEVATATHVGPYSRVSEATTPSRHPPPSTVASSTRRPCGRSTGVRPAHRTSR